MYLDWHPSEILKRFLEEHKITLPELASKTGIEVEALELTLAGHRNLNHTLLEKIGNVLYSDPTKHALWMEYWLGLESSYTAFYKLNTQTYPCPHQSCGGTIKTPPTIATGQQIDCICKACVLERTSTGFKFVRMGRL